MYRASLLNCALIDATYSLVVGNLAILKSIKYNITYKCSGGHELSFVALVVKNQLKIVSVPEGVEEGKPYRPPSL